MALRALMLKRKIDDAKKALEELRKKDAEFETREKELTAAIDEAETDEEKEAVEDEVDKFDEEKKEHTDKVAGLEKAVADLESELNELESKPEEPATEEIREMKGRKITPEELRDMPRSSMEYRTAFRDYVVSGKKSDILEFEKREDQVTKSSELGVLIPTTIMQEIITAIGGVYGQLYAKVRKTNLKGGVKYPIGSFSATFNRVAEDGVSYRQKVTGITGSVDFSYKVGEIRLAKTILEEVLEVPVFEQKFAECIAEAYVKAMDTEIMTGSETNEMVGILTEAAAVSSRIAANHIIEFTAADMADWTKWQTKLFAAIPLKMRSLNPEFVMTANTYESNIKTLKDSNNRPVYAETFNPIDGAERATFKGKEVTFVEEDILENFNDATDGEYFGMYWVPDKAYCINENMQFTVVDYFDHDTNQFVKKALVINDGKVLDPSYIFLLKKSVPATTDDSGTDEGGSDADDTDGTEAEVTG